MKQFLAVAALNEAVKKHCDTRRDVKIYTEGFKAVQHEAMEFSVMCDGELYQLEKLHEELRQAGFPNPSSMCQGSARASPNLLSDQGQLHLDQLPDSASAGCFGYTGRSESRGTFGAVCLWPQHQ